MIVSRVEADSRLAIRSGVIELFRTFSTRGLELRIIRGKGGSSNVGSKKNEENIELTNFGWSLKPTA